MNRGIIKAVMGGLFIGAAVFFAPFLLLKTMLFFFIIGGIIRMLFWRRMYHWGRPHMYMAMADKVRHMSEEEYTEMKNKMNNWQGHCHTNGCHNYYSQTKTNNNETK
jgi:hypothetical protein